MGIRAKDEQRQRVCPWEFCGRLHKSCAFNYTKHDDFPFILGVLISYRGWWHWSKQQNIVTRATLEQILVRAGVAVSISHGEYTSNADHFKPKASCRSYWEA